MSDHVPYATCSNTNATRWPPNAVLSNACTESAMALPRYTPRLRNGTGNDVAAPDGEPVTVCHSPRVSAATTQNAASRRPVGPLRRATPRSRMEAGQVEVMARVPLWRDVGFIPVSE